MEKASLSFRSILGLILGSRVQIPLLLLLLQRMNDSILQLWERGVECDYTIGQFRTKKYGTRFSKNETYISFCSHFPLFHYKPMLSKLVFLHACHAIDWKCILLSIPLCRLFTVASCWSGHKCFMHDQWWLQEDKPLSCRVSTVFQRAVHLSSETSRSC